MCTSISAVFFAAAAALFLYRFLDHLMRNECFVARTQGQNFAK